MQSLLSALRLGFPLGLLGLLVPLSGVLAADGSLGIFTSQNATSCELRVPSGTTRTFYLVLAPDGSTRGGVAGAEFQIDPDQATGYLVLSSEPMQQGAVGVGDAFTGGTTLGWSSSCPSGITIPILRFQVMNLGSGAEDAPLFVKEHARPTNPLFPCALANLCDAPAFTKVCISGGMGVLNATTEVACGSGALRGNWSGVKALYR